MKNINGNKIEVIIENIYNLFEVHKKWGWLMVIFEYKCKRCGLKRSIESETIINNLDLFVANTNERNVSHKCIDGGFGVADFVGCIESI